MTVAELIAVLQNFPQEMEVVTPGFDESNFEPVETVIGATLSRAIYQDPGHYSEWEIDPDEIAETKAVVVIDFSAPAKYSRLLAEGNNSEG